MESKWRMNVLEFDGVDSAWEYFARLDAPSIPPYNYLIKLRGFQAVYYGYVAFGQFQYYSGGAPPPIGHPHFPWGEAVESD